MLSILQTQKSKKNGLRDKAERTNNKQLVARLSGFGETPPDFKETKAVFLVSVGGEYFEGEDLIVQLKLIKEKFGSCIILVGDKLQRYNILADNSTDVSFDMNQAEAQAIQKGKEWINRNYNYFSTILGFNFFEVQRWDSWLINEYFNFCKKAIEDLLIHAEEYRTALKESIEEYGERHKKKIGTDKFLLIESSFAKCCREYLIEEAAVMIVLAKQGYKSALYPAKQTSFLHATSTLLIQPTYPNMMQWIPIRFKRVSQDFPLNDLTNNLTANATFFSVPKAEYNPTLPNVEMLAKIACEQINCFLKQLESEQERKIFLEFLSTRIFPKEERKTSNHFKPYYG